MKNGLYPDGREMKVRLYFGEIIERGSPEFF